jgi:hypothetical protein
MEQKREPSQYFRSLTTEEKQKMYPTAFGSSLFNMYQNIDSYVNERRTTHLIFYRDRYYVYKGDNIVSKGPRLISQEVLSKFTPEEKDDAIKASTAAMLAFFHIIPLIVETDDHVQQFMRIKEKTEDRVEIEVFPQEE